MIFYDLRQNKNKDSKAFKKWFAYPEIKETVDLDDLAAHMSSHNMPFSKGAIKGILTDMVSCIKELLLEGKNVKIADLAIFSLGIKNTKGGADSEKEFSVVKHIQGVKLRARATGDLITKNLNLDASLKKATAGNTSPQPSPNGEGAGQTEGGENGNQNSGENGGQGSGDNGGGGGTDNSGGNMD
jgi:predicted histone-like DNA-binding protein